METATAPAAASAETITPTDKSAIAVDTKAPADKAADAPAKHKVKIDGEEREVTLEELIRGFQTDQTGQKRLKEISDKEKLLGVEKEKTGKVVAALKSGNYEALRELGLSDEDIEKISVQALSAKQQAKLEEERRKALDPEKRELEDLRREKEERAKKDKEDATASEQEQIETATTQLRGHVMETLDLLPEKFRGSSFFANRVLEAWEYAIEHQAEIEKRGIKITPQLIAEKALAEGTSSAKDLFLESLSKATDEQLATMFPPELLERIKKLGTAVEDPIPAAGAQHPSLGAKPQVRAAGEKKPEGKRRIGEAEAMRAVYFPKK